MQLVNFLHLCAMFLGFGATFFLCRVIFKSNESIMRSTYHYSSIGWPSVEIISDKASQKINGLASIIFVFLALLVNLCSIFLDQDELFFSTVGKAFSIALLVVAVIIIIIVSMLMFFVTKQVERNMKTFIAKDRLKFDLEESSSPLYSSVTSIAEEYFSFTQEVDESDVNFVKRYANFIGYEIPDEINLSKLNGLVAE